MVMEKMKLRLATLLIPAGKMRKIMVAQILLVAAVVVVGKVIVTVRAAGLLVRRVIVQY
jgi:hypothetical protein